MTISDKLLERGRLVGLEPTEGESSRKFGSRVRKEEKARLAPSPVIGTRRGR